MSSKATRVKNKREADIKRENRKQNQKSQEEVVQAGWTMVFCILMLAVFPLFYRNNYIDITQSKQRFFLMVGFVYVAATLILQGRNLKKIFLLPTMADKFAMALFVTVCISTVLSENWKDVFLGNSGRYFGADVLLLSILCYFCVSKTFSGEKAKYVLFFMGLSASMIFLLEVLNTFQMDPLQMKRNLVDTQWSIFISTLGQLNVNAAMNSFLLAVFGSLYMTTEKRSVKMLLSPVCILGSMAMVCCRSDSAVVILFVLIAIFCWYSLGKRESLFRGVFYMALQLLGLHIMALLAGKWESHMYSLNSLNLLVIQWKVLIISDVVCLLLFALVWICYKAGESPDSPLHKKIQKLILIFGILAGAGLGVWLLLNFQLTDTFGGGRGYIWKKTVQEFMTLPWWQKLFGVGMNNFSQLVAPWKEETIALFGNPFIDAHNEYLQYLATIGILGAVSYFGFLLSMLWEKGKTLAGKKENLFPIALILVYLIQALVNNPLTFTVPYCFVLWGILKKSDTLYN